MAELSPTRILAELKKNGATHVVWLPDSETNFLYVLMSEEPSMDLVPVSREGPRFLHCRWPRCRWQKARYPHPEHRHDGVWRLLARLGPWHERPGGDDGRISWLDPPRRYHRHRRLLHRALPPCVQHQLLPVESDEDADRISIAFAEAQREKRPVAVLVGDEYHGFNVSR